MRALLVTSQVTFVPHNYDDLVLPLAQNPHIVGLLVVENRSLDILIKSLLMMISLSAPRLGWQLLRNLLSSSLPRHRTYTQNGKTVLYSRDVNSSDTLSTLRGLDLDLIINARTRSFFRTELLSLPKNGCVNIHHGLLPDQRGVMCDLWAHLEGEPSGFTIHRMSEKLDDGEILRVVPVQTSRRCYLESIQLSAVTEAKTLTELLATPTLTPIENKKSERTRYRKNPRLQDFYQLRRKGIKI